MRAADRFVIEELMRPTNESTLTNRFQLLITGYAKLCSKETINLGNVLSRLLPGFLSERAKWVESQRKSADEFNFFQVMGIETKEVAHSTLLAWLLDPKIERGTHAQGKLGFRLFLEEFAKELQNDGGDITDYADADFWVSCEVKGHESRVDIEIASQSRFLIHIENKFFSAEGTDQTNREWRDLCTRRNQLGVPEACCHPIFLTLDSSPAENKNFRSVGWNRVARILEKFAEQALPLEVKLFARHYAKAIRKFSILEPDEMEATDGDI